MDIESDESRSSSILDSDVEEGLYSQIYHGHNLDQVQTVSGNFSINFCKSHTNDIDIFDHNQLTCTTSNATKSNEPFCTPFATAALKCTNVKKPTDVVVIDSSDDCEVIEDEVISKYRVSRDKQSEISAQLKKRKWEEVEVISSDDDYDATNLYIHVDNQASTSATPCRTETVDFFESSLFKSVSDSKLSDVIEICSSPESSPLKKVTSTPTAVNHMKSRGKPSLSFEEFLEKEMNRYYTRDTHPDISERTSREVISSLKGNCDDWFVASVDRRFSKKSRYSKKDRIVCNNCRQRGHIAAHCPDPKKPIICHVCGGNHLGTHCNQRSCDLCWQTGHASRNCKERKKILKMKCTICKCYGHSAKFCPDMWRKYHLSTQPGPPVISQLSLKSTAFAYCPNCGKKGHFVHQCENQLMDDYIFPTRPDIVSYSGILATPDINRTQAPNWTPQSTSQKPQYTIAEHKGELIRVLEGNPNNQHVRKGGFKKRPLRQNNIRANFKPKTNSKQKFNRFKNNWRKNNWKKNKAKKSILHSIRARKASNF
ncbi:Zinc finger CCHC domain-containing protein 7 [Chamberlinius hualienensis]